MDFTIFIRGIIIGFSIAAPVGPIGILCIKRTLNGGRISGFISGLGAATADTLYGALAGFGVTFVATFLIEHNLVIRVVGSLILIYLGVRTFVSPPSQKEIKVSAKGLIGEYVSTFFLTLSNPLTILAFAAIFAGLGIQSENGSYMSAVTLIVGLFLG